MNNTQVLSSGFHEAKTVSSRVRQWRRAIDRFEKARSEWLSAIRNQDVAEQKEFRARKALNDIKVPASLRVEVAIELYFNNGVLEPIHRRYTDTQELRDEKMILGYAKDDLVLRDRLLGELRRWQGRRQRREADAVEAKALSEGASSAASVALHHHDAMLLRLLCMPSPSITELRWKIGVLLDEDCGCEIEQKGWAYLKDELAIFLRDEALGSSVPN